GEELEVNSSTVPLKPSYPRRGSISGGLADQLEDLRAELGECRIGARRHLIARTVEVDVDDPGDTCRTLAEHDDPIRQVHGLIDVVRDDDDGHAEALPDLQAEILQLEPGLSVHRRER